MQGFDSQFSIGNEPKKEPSNNPRNEIKEPVMIFLCEKRGVVMILGFFWVLISEREELWK